MSRPDAPIGVFDSGLGGLTVVRQMRKMLPQERVIYVADQAHVPYGGRDLDEVRGFAFGISHALREAGCKALVMACNISSAVALPTIRAEFPDLPVLGVILPGARAAMAQTQNGKVGVLATAGTVKSRAYNHALQRYDAIQHIIAVSCPAFVPLVEAGEIETPAAVSAAIEYLEPLCSAGVDTVILGCTHYPFLLPTLKKIAPHLRYIDPAEATVAALARELKKHNLNAVTSSPLPDRLTTTGDVTAFSAQLCRFLPDTDAPVALARWQGSELYLPLRSQA
jgi:glutamate racemase